MAIRTVMVGHGGKLMPIYLLAISVFAATPFVLRKTGSLGFASSLPLLLVCVCLPVVAWLNGGPLAPVLGLMPAFALLSVAFAPRRLARLMTSVLVLEGVLLLLLHRGGHVFDSELSASQRMDLSVISILIATVSTFGMAARCATRHGRAAAR